MCPALHLHSPVETELIYVQGTGPFLPELDYWVADWAGAVDLSETQPRVRTARAG